MDGVNLTQSPDPPVPPHTPEPHPAPDPAPPLPPGTPYPGTPVEDPPPSPPDVPPMPPPPIIAGYPLNSVGPMDIRAMEHTAPGLLDLIRSVPGRP